MNDFPPIVLASKSPRRMALLHQAGIAFEVDSADIDETPRAGECPAGFVVRMAVEKALATRSHRGDTMPVLGADTAVVLDYRIYGKPRDRLDARKMLESLSDRIHEVHSGVALIDAQGSIRSRHSISKVTFGKLDPRWIDAYIASGEPMDKAGAYGVQGLAASRIRHLSGSYWGVMGLPLYETTELLLELNGI